MSENDDDHFKGLSYNTKKGDRRTVAPRVTKKDSSTKLLNQNTKNRSTQLAFPTAVNKPRSSSPSEQSSWIPYIQGQWHAREPRTYGTALQSLLVNSYVEIGATLISALALVYPSYTSLLVTLLTQILLVGVPIQILKEQGRRLKCYKVVSLGMFGIILSLFSYKLLIDDAPIDYWSTYAFDILSALLFAMIYVTNRKIKSEVDTSFQLKMSAITYLGNRHFSSKFHYFKYMFLILTLLEVLMIPDLLAVPVLYALLFLTISSVIKTTAVRNRQSIATFEYLRAGESLVEYLLNKERLFSVILAYQKVVMFIQLFETIIFKAIGPNATELTQLSMASQILQNLGHNQNIQSDLMLTVTVASILTGQLFQKAISQHFYLEKQDEINGQNLSYQLSKRTQVKLMKNALQVLDATLKVYKVITLDNSSQTITEFRKTFYGLLPVHLTWLVRFVVTVFAYMYNSYVGWFHLLWVIASFIIPTRQFYDISVILGFPMVLAEFTMVYVSSVGYYSDADFFKLEFIQLFNFNPRQPFLELSLMYIVVVLVGFMIPARQRHIAYAQSHNGSEMTKDMLVKNIKDTKSSVIWKIMFILAVRLHTPVLYLMLFMGNQNFNLFQLGFMSFFIIYGASHSLYVKTSILLPLFVAWFILSQYWWSLAYATMPDYNVVTDFFYIVDGWEPAQDVEDFYFARMPNFTLWALFMLMYLLHKICQQFPDKDQNLKYLAECESHIFDRIPRIAKYVKLVWDTLFIIIVIGVIFWVATDLIMFKSNLINLVYLILFVVTFGEMCSTSLDGSSHKICIFYADLIKRYSASVLVVLVTYHMLRFELFDLDEWFVEMKEKRSFWLLYLQLIGFSEDESQTKVSVQSYTAYLIIGQILEYYFDVGRQKVEARDLYDWNNAFQTYRGTQRAHRFFKFDVAYLVYRCFSLWRYIDMTATYFHLLTNGVIVYFSVKVSVSLFFAIHMSIIVGFYCYTAYKMNSVQIPLQVFTMQHATDACRHYKKNSSDLFLKARQNLWMTQYVITLCFMFTGYLDDFVENFQKWSDPQGTLIDKFDTVQFYLYWTGCYFPEKSFSYLEGVKPVHFVFLILLCEKQAQNWLYSRWGLNETMISKFAKLEFLMKLEKKGKEWLPQDTTNSGYVKNCQEVMKGENAVTVDIKMPNQHQNKLMMEEFNSALICTWQRIKLKTLVIKAIQNGIKRNFTVGEKIPAPDDVLAQLRAEDEVDTMTSFELSSLERELCKVFQQPIELRNFKKYKVRINGKDCVLYARIKESVLEQLYAQKKINQSVIPFLSYSLVKTLRQDIQQRLQLQFVGACQAHISATQGEDIMERVVQEQQNIRLFQLRRDLAKVVSRRYSYEIWGDARLLFEQVSLMLLTVNIIVKCNITSLVYLVLATAFLLKQSKQTIMRQMVYTVGTMCFLQYWVYLLNLTSQSSPTPFPKMPYPNQKEPYGDYLIPIMYKFEFGRNMKFAYWYSFGVELFTVEALWIDFFIFAFVAIYLYYYTNPVLTQQGQGFTWYSNTESEEAHKASQLPENQNKPLDFLAKLAEYHHLMNEIYPSESEFGNSVKKRLRSIKDSCPTYLFVRNSRLLTYTTMHIFTMIVVMLMALCRRSFVSLVYVVALAPCLRSSATVLQQHNWFCKQNEEIQECWNNPEFQGISAKQQNKIIKSIQNKYKWSFISLICVYLSIYSYLDFLSQVVYQIPYVPELQMLEHFGLHKVYPPSRDTFDYNVYISGTYKAPKIDVGNLLMQVLNCVILVTISAQSELFKSKGYNQFLQKPDRGLDLLMKLAKLKRNAITYAYNNAKMMKILALQKTEQQIFGTAERIKVNVDMYRKSQQRIMLEEYCLTYGGMYIPPNPQPQLNDSQGSNPKLDSNEVKTTPMQRLVAVLLAERQRREKLLDEQTIVVVTSVLPFRARLYLFMMTFSQSYIFIYRMREMQMIEADMYQGHQNTGIDLNQLIRSDLLAYLKHIEMEKGEMITQWPPMKLSDLRQTKIFCKWFHVIARLVSSIFTAVISNTASIAYLCMLMSMYTNAGIVAIIYPTLVFGYALLEETRPGKRFWRFMLIYSLSVLLLKYIVNIKIVNLWLDETTLPIIDSFVKFGLHHLEQTTDLVQHMLPEMLIVTAILCHEIVEQQTGLYDQCETEVETVPQAIDRIFKQTTRQYKSEKISESASSSDSQIQYSFQDSHEQSSSSSQSSKIEDSLGSISQGDVPEPVQKKTFWTRSYMDRIFPSVQQQKPGTDYYGYLTFVKCCLCLYLLNNFNDFSATGPYQETDILQTEMVIVLFSQIFMLIMERYIARTENREQIQRIKRTNDQIKPTIDPAQLFMPVKHDDMTVKLVIQNLKFQDLADKQHIQSLAKLRHEQGIDIEMTDSVVTNQQKCKFILHWLNLILVHAYIFWYLPIQANIILYGEPTCGEIYGCKDFRRNETLQMFYLLYLIYFYLSARQISQGLPSFRRGSSTMYYEGSDTFEEQEDIGNGLHQIFVNMPLIVEIRCLLDFTLTKTALDMWQTCQLFQYNSDFYIAKTANRWYNRKVLGDEPPFFSKYACGHLCTTMMLSFVLVPFVMFSNINGMTKFNPVVDNNIQFWVQVNLTTTRLEDQFLTMDQQVLPFKLYENESPQIYDYDQEMYDKRHYGEWPETKFFSPDQVQLIVASEFSDTIWIASEMTRNSLQKYACIQDMQYSPNKVPLPGCQQFANVTNINNVTIGFQLKTLFKREGPDGAKDAQGMQQRNLDPANPSDQILLEQFIEISTGGCKNDDRYTMNITDFYKDKILLSDTSKVDPVYFTIRETELEATQNLLLTYKCRDQWAITTDSSQLELTVFSQRIKVGWLQGYDIMTFYTGIVLVLGMYLRPVFIWTSNRAFIYEITHPDPMLRLCESVHLYRTRGDLKMEEENFRLLQDILRSPEIMHLLTGSNMKGGVAPSDQEQKATLVPKAY